MKLEELEVYGKSVKLAELVWNEVSGWNYFNKDTIGKQLVRAADSISANIAEGYGRYFYKENKQFCYYSRGSLLETKSWLEKAFNRKLLSEETYKSLNHELEIIHKMLNAYIKSIGTKMLTAEFPLTSDK
jgi:four helix bundle protein